MSVPSRDRAFNMRGRRERQLVRGIVKFASTSSRRCFLRGVEGVGVFQSRER